jgi:hypothetical protein
MTDMRDLPSQREVNSYANWALITIVLMFAAAGVSFGLWKLFPGLSFAALMVILGLCMIPVFTTFGIAIRHGIRSWKLRRAEQKAGGIVYTNKIGAFMDQHMGVVAIVVIGGSLIIAVIWAVLDPKR